MIKLSLNRTWIGLDWALDFDRIVGLVNIYDIITYLRLANYSQPAGIYNHEVSLDSNIHIQGLLSSLMLFF